ncbi:unnamed protein product [Rhizoctonia solani]|uniref:Uncharacterized protein n=1 Tax=Rhizoctonia solani TaxID=456999 RepID=A0A8H3DLZ0_9AGAM|nr:unnamed protein product [Rhizoctonia solani]
MKSLVPALPICNALAIVLVLLPVSWHWKAKNTGTLLYIGWIILGNLNIMINTIIWRGSYEDLAPRWCDISVKIIIGHSVGLVAASLCINRKLYNIATLESVTITPESKRRDAIVDLCVGILLPIIVMVLHYVVQPTRYNIIENIGCWPNLVADVHTTLLTIAMVYIWPILISCVSFIYCTLSIRGFLKARRQFNQVLSHSGSGINISRYFRLMALASEEILFSIPFATFLLKQNVTLAKQIPWISWEDTHKNYNTILKTPWALLKSSEPSFNAVMISLWVLPAGGFLFFIWFGLGGEAFVAYKSMFYTIAAPIGIKPKPNAAPTTTCAPSRNPGRDLSLPDLNEVGEKRPSNEDLEAGKTYAAYALAIVLVLLPISWHWKAKNTGTLLYIGWTVLANLNIMINTIIWRGSYDDLAPRWCDISVKIIIGQSVGLTAASLCINRKLYNIATIQSKRRDAIVDLCLGILFPIIVMALHYVVQPTRYNIIENIGCWPTINDSIMSIPMVFMWPIIISCVSFMYCTLSIRGFLKVRRQFQQVLSHSGSGINMSRYFRLMALASEEILFAIPFASYLLKQNLTVVSQKPWTSWQDAHKDYEIVRNTSWMVLKASGPSFNAVMISLWVLPAGGFLFFIWFGLSGEALTAYKNMFYTIAAPFGIKSKLKTASTSIYVPARNHAGGSSLSNHNDAEERKSSDKDLEAAKAHMV